MSGEPMDQVARKIKKGVELDHKELEVWVQYNFLALPQKEQDTV